MYADRAKIIIISGKGGDGHVSFRREKYVPDGGPDGGDGGRGGDVIFQVDKGMNTLTDYRYRRKFAAGAGEDGKKRNCKGADGEDLILKVPEGTVISDAESGRVIIDMSGECQRYKILSGGKGGLGNQHYATPKMQAPKYAQPGQPAKEIEIKLELKLIADVGLVGFPSVGKSTFLASVTNARPKIADYHFTTLEPQLGVVEMGDGNAFVLADIPGLIEGAADGQGLGLDFLRHIERNKLLIHIVDVAAVEGRDPLEDYHKINAELAKYGEAASSIPQIVAANKIDLLPETPEAVDIDEDGELIYGEDPVERLKKALAGDDVEVYPISTATGKGVKTLLDAVWKKLKELPDKPMVFATEYTPDAMMTMPDDPYQVSFDPKSGEYILVGPGIDKMLGYTNLDSEKGFSFFQTFLKERGILEELEKLGIKDGDTVRMYGFSFEYWH